MNVFISYASSDRDLADTLAETLSEFGLDAWQAEKNVLPGENWAKKIGEALEESDALVVILSPDAEHTSLMRSEISFAMGNKQFKNKVIPIYRGDEEEIDKENIPWAVQKRGISLDAYSTPEEAFEEVARSLKSEHNPA